MILFLAIFLAVFLVALPVGFLLLRRRAPNGASVVSSADPNAADFGKPDNWQPPTGTVTEERRDQLLRNLDTVERGVSRFYIVLVCLVMAAITGLAVFLYIKLPNDGNRDFLILYGGGLYLI